MKFLGDQPDREAITLEVAPDGVLWVKASGEIVYANPAMERLSGYSADELVGAPLEQLIPSHLRRSHGQYFRRYFERKSPSAMRGSTLLLAHKDGQEVKVDISLGHWSDKDENYAVAFVRDLSEREAFEEHLRHQATHDTLTQLPNRALFMLQLETALAQAKRAQQVVTVMMIDLDEFKEVNDTHGHHAGDDLLVQAAQRMRKALRESDILARMGGDEFCVLLVDSPEHHDAAAVARKILHALGDRFDLAHTNVGISASIGIAQYPHDGKRNETLLRFADMAMYQSKQAGRSTFSHYSTALGQRARETLMIQTSLREVIEQDTLALHYQPRVDMRSGHIVGVEALLRWPDSPQGAMSPAKFLAVADRGGLLMALERRALMRACRQIAQSEAQQTPLTVAVNLSKRQFRRTDLVAEIAYVLNSTGASPQWLELEITEAIATETPEFSRQQIAGLHALGCKIALDDFGSGLSWLNQLKDLPLSRVKIGPDCVRAITAVSSDTRVIQSLVNLAQSFGFEVTSVGVENQQQRDFLQQLGCSSWQGALYSHAVDEDALSRLMQAQRSAEF